MGKLSPGPGLSAEKVAASQLARIYDATIGIVAEQGYKALKVRDVVSYAEVSTRAFYELFSSKEDCFLRAYDRVIRRATERMIAAQEGASDWRDRAQLVFEEFVRGLEADPARARVALIEAYAIGEPVLDRAWQAERLVEGMVAESFTRPPSGMVVTPLVVEGMVAGIATVSRHRLRTGALAELRDGREELVGWALCCSDKVAGELPQLDRRPMVTHFGSASPVHVSLDGEDHSWARGGDRDLLLTAVVELAMVYGYAGLTAPRVRSFAGVSRKKFEALFSDLEDCYSAAIEQRAAEAIALATHEQAHAQSWPGGVYRAIAALCEYIAGDAFLARVCLTDDFPSGARGRRSRQGLLDAIRALLAKDLPMETRLGRLATEASGGAVWSLFHHHVIRDWVRRRQIAATLSYLALAPAIGASEAVMAIQSEQGA